MRILRAYEIRERFFIALKKHLEDKKKKINNFEKNIFLLSPTRVVKLNKEKVSSYYSKIHKSFEKILMLKKERLSVLSGKIDALSPLKILSKGYSIVFDFNTNKVIKNSSDTNIGNLIKVRLFKGTIIGEVKDRSE